MHVRRKKFEEEDEDQHDRWLISYADFITLLFAFFVVMYATSNINLNKYRALSHAVVNAFQGNVTANSTSAGGKTAAVSVLKPLPLSHIYQEKRQRDAEKLHALAQILANQYASWIEKSLIHIYQNPRGIRIDIQDQLLFEANTLVLSTQARDMMRQLAHTLKNEYRILEIEGHSHQGRVKALPAPPSAWEASALKAARVTESLVQEGMIEQRLSVKALAHTRPLSSSENAFALATNQRVAIWIMSVDMDESALDTSADNQIYPESSPPKTP